MTYINSITGYAIGSINVSPMALQIETNMIKLSHKEFEIDFELNPKKLDNIDTIIINGYKYVKA